MNNFLKNFEKKSLILIGLILFIFSLFRYLWTTPQELIWITQFTFLDDAIKFINSDYSSISLFHVGTGHALTFAKYIEILNVYLFSHNTWFEISIYFSFMAIFLLILYKSLVNYSKINFNISFFIIILLFANLLSLNGVALMGMEISHGSGVLILFSFFTYSLLLDKKYSKFDYKVLFYIPILVFFFLGGYAIPFFISLFISVTLIFFSELLKNFKLNSSLCNYFKENIKNYLKENIKIFTVLFSLFLSLFFYSLMLKNNIPDLDLSSLARNSLVKGSDLIKILFLSFLQPFVTSDQLEFFPNTKYFVIFITSLSMILVVSHCLYLIFSNNFLIRIKLLLLLMIFYGLSTTLLVMTTRPFGTYWILNMWYAFHYKFFICGLLLTYYFYYLQMKDNFMKNKIHFYLMIIALFFIFIAMSVSNYTKYKRNPHEKGYFMNIIDKIKNPQEVSCVNGFSELRIPCEQTEDAILMLKKYKIGPYKND